MWEKGRFDIFQNQNKPYTFLFQVFSQALVCFFDFLSFVVVNLWWFNKKSNANTCQITNVFF
ncbi:MAG: hypothetical protein CMF61_03980 [Magnetococcales bacterium]|nr:hypothetical protein [Magnetococcales bacterium]